MAEANICYRSRSTCIIYFMKNKNKFLVVVYMLFWPTSGSFFFSAGYWYKQNTWEVVYKCIYLRDYVLFI
jgi:hypothetical protein